MPTERIYSKEIDPRAALPRDWNPRTILPANRARLKRTLLTFGFAGGACLDEDDQIIGGHQRIAIMAEIISDGTLDDSQLRALNIYPCRIEVVEGLTEQEKGALNIVLNNPGAQGDWNGVGLLEVIGELVGEGDFDATLTGFDASTLERMMAPLGTEPSPNFEPGAIAQPSTSAAAGASGAGPTSIICPNCDHRFTR